MVFYQKFILLYVDYLWLHCIKVGLVDYMNNFEYGWILFIKIRNFFMNNLSK